jgi:subtilase family serine protease
MAERRSRLRPFVETRRLAIEKLEPRHLLSADLATPLGPIVDPDTGETVVVSSQANVLATSLDPAVTQPIISGYTPVQVRHAYGFDRITFAGGIAGDGRGQTIAIVDAFDAPTILSDLQTFDRTFGLPDPPQFTKVAQTGGTRFPRIDTGWALETSLDVEWAHAVAPAAKILLVEANSNNLSDLLTAVNFARQQPGVSVVSMSWGGREFRTETWYDGYFSTPNGHAGVTFVASSGDSGAPSLWPAVSPNVVAVGGTTLSINKTGNIGGETGWSGSGGGMSLYEAKPAFQSQLTQNRFLRLGPDVAYDANPTTGFAVYDTTKYLGYTGWIRVGGTSAGAPQWAGLIAIANQGRALAKQGPLANTDAALYSLPSADFHDVLSGSNFYTANKGFDLVTGLGSPTADLVVRDLVNYGLGKFANTGGGSAISAADAGVQFGNQASDGASEVLPLAPVDRTTYASTNDIAGDTTYQARPIAIPAVDFIYQRWGQAVAELHNWFTRWSNDDLLDEVSFKIGA